MALTAEQRKRFLLQAQIIREARREVAKRFMGLPMYLPDMHPNDELTLAVADHMTACEALLRDILLDIRATEVTYVPKQDPRHWTRELYDSTIQSWRTHIEAALLGSDAAEVTYDYRPRGVGQRAGGVEGGEE